MTPSGIWIVGSLDFDKKIDAVFFRISAAMTLFSGLPRSRVSVPKPRPRVVAAIGGGAEFKNDRRVQPRHRGGRQQDSADHLGRAVEPANLTAPPSEGLPLRLRDDGEMSCTGRTGAQRA